MAVARLWPALTSRGEPARGRIGFSLTPFESFCQKEEPDPLIRPPGHPGYNLSGGMLGHARYAPIESACPLRETTYFEACCSANFPITGTMNFSLLYAL